MCCSIAFRNVPYSGLVTPGHVSDPALETPAKLRYSLDASQMLLLTLVVNFISDDWPESYWGTMVLERSIDGGATYSVIQTQDFSHHFATNPTGKADKNITLQSFLKDPGPPSVGFDLFFRWSYSINSTSTTAVGCTGASLHIIQGKIAP